MRLSRKASPDDKGSTATIRDSLEQLYKSSGILDPLLAAGTELPKCGEWLWDLWQELNQERQYDQGRPLAITSTLIKDHCFLKRLTLTPLELQLLRVLDVTYLNEISKEA